MIGLPRLSRLIGVAAFASFLIGPPEPIGPAAAQPNDHATIVLVHGAFEGSGIWNPVALALKRDGYSVFEAANPLRSLQADAGYISDLVRSTPGPVVLVGHSYGGSVISDAAFGRENVKALVYVAALAPDAGESAFDVVGRFAGSILGDSLKAPVSLSTGAHDLYVQPEAFSKALAADLPSDVVDTLAQSQRPVTDAALKEASSAPAWRAVPSFFIYGGADKSIVPEAHQFMARRAKAKQIVRIDGASHLVMLSHPDEVARLIKQAAEQQGGTHD